MTYITQLRFGLSHFKKPQQMLSKLTEKKKYTFVVSSNSISQHREYTGQITVYICMEHIIM